MEKIVFKNVQKVYPGKRKVEAIKDFSLTINSNEFLVIIGPSGCGKSTLLRLISGLEKLTAGKIFIDGKDISGLEPQERDVSMVFQNFTLYPHLTVYKNIAYVLSLKKMKKDAVKLETEKILKLLNISDLADRLPKTLSGGQKQRVALGRAIAKKSTVSLLDEPLSNLDAKLRTEMRSEIIELHKKTSTTSIYVTHDQTEAMTMADRIVVMKDGVIQQVGSPKEIYDNPQNTFVAQFFGTPAINMIQGEIKNKNGTIFFQKDNFEISLSDSRYNDILREYIDQKVILGVRPENIKIVDEMIGINIFSATIIRTELLGQSSNLYLVIGNEIPLTASIFCSDFSFDTSIYLQIKADNVLIFDSSSEKNLLNSGD